MPQATHRQDAPVWRTLAPAGTVLLGKLNMHVPALGTTTDNAVFGPCMNPLREGHTPGGSSGLQRFEAVAAPGHDALLLGLAQSLDTLHA